MLVNLNTGPDGTRRELILQSQGYADEQRLETLLAAGVASGFGRNARTGMLLHLTVTLAPRSGDSPAAESASAASQES